MLKIKKEISITEDDNQGERHNYSLRSGKVIKMVFTSMTTATEKWKDELKY